MTVSTQTRLREANRCRRRCTSADRQQPYELTRQRLWNQHHQTNLRLRDLDRLTLLESSGPVHVRQPRATNLRDNHKLKRESYAVLARPTACGPPRDEIELQ